MKTGTDAESKVARAGKKICMLVYSFYENDNRVMRYARALVERGDQVDVIALANGSQPPSFEVVDGVNVHRIQRRLRNEKGKYAYLYRLLKFCAKSSLVLSRFHLKRRYDLVHVHNVPDFLVYSAWLPRLTGAKVILDIHDILPEFFANKFGKPEHSPYVRLLKIIEKLSAGFANHVIISNHLWSEKATARSMAREKCSVFINYVDLNLFRSRRTRNDGRFVMLYHGGLQRHQGLDLAIRAFDKACRQKAEAEFHIYGGGNMKPELQALVQELGLDGRVFLRESVPAREVADIVANADLGIVAKRADSFGNEAYSTKIMEFMAGGVPVIVSRTKVDSFYFNESVVRFFNPGDENDLATAMLDLMDNHERRKSLVRLGHEYVLQNNWDTRKQMYLRLVDSLIARTEFQPTGLSKGSTVHP
jgi:glycosyltransferase involved in cell wall biosynthesis